MRRLALLALLAGAACGSPLTPIDGDLSEQRALWQSQGLRNYDYDLAWWSEWFEAGPPQRVEVRGGTVARVLSSTGEVVDHSEWNPAPPTIDSLFARAIRFREASDAVVNAKFDRQLHYPTYLLLDRTGWADDAVGYTASNLVRR